MPLGWSPQFGRQACAVWTPPARARDFSGIDVTVQRSAASSSWNPITVNTCVPSGSSGSWILTGLSNNGVEPWRTKSLLNLRLTKTEIGATFGGATADRVEPGASGAVTCCASASVVTRLHRRGRHHGVIRTGGRRPERTGKRFRLRGKKAWIGDLERPGIVGRDDDAGAAPGELPQSNGKVLLQANTAV